MKKLQRFDAAAGLGYTLSLRQQKVTVLQGERLFSFTHLDPGWLETPLEVRTL
jgi:hypothetical protein